MKNADEQLSMAPKLLTVAFMVFGAILLGQLAYILVPIPADPAPQAAEAAAVPAADVDTGVVNVNPDLVLTGGPALELPLAPTFFEADADDSLQFIQGGELFLTLPWRTGGIDKGYVEELLQHQRAGHRVEVCVLLDGKAHRCETAKRLR